MKKQNGVIAPLPGKILKILVGEGQVIKVKDPIVILESMKMENVITSDIAGVVKEICCKEDSFVKFDELLVKFED